jgi:deoxyadenosine/deoxycytidine kinase
MGLVVIVEGLIGAGKSTLTAEIGKALGEGTLTLMEPDERGGNPYLADFYADKHRWAFSMQVHLLGVRYQMQLAAQWHAMSGRGHAVLDRSFYGDTCFARMMTRTGEITEREFETYRTVYRAMTASVLLPSACVRLRVDPEVAAERIRRRASEREGRRSELVIDLDYLRALDEEIDATVGVLERQGVRVLELPWNVDRATAEDRAREVANLAEAIRFSTPTDLLLRHHARVLA